ncbi:MAG TPA: Ig-like domain-containing protein [Nitrospirota bacterium]|nr:Ig-like domain-containing protein [Nitrospirota bacterium]
MKFHQNRVAMFFCASILLSACGAGGGANTNASNASLQSIEITPTNPTNPIGTIQHYNATGIYSDHSTQDITTMISWDSSNTAVATITSPGVAKTTAVGTTTIIATNGTITASTTLTVTSAQLQSIAVTPTNPTIAKGTTQQFIATGIYSDNSTQHLTTSVIWSSSTAAVAIIGTAQGFIGKATSQSVGTTTITASDPATNITGSTTLTVTAATLVAISVTPTNPSTALGTSQQFIATGIYSDNSTQNITASVTWNSSSLSAATISNVAGSNGLATLVSPGATTITATVGSMSGSTMLSVTPATLVSVAIASSSPSIALGIAQQFTATGTYSDGSTQNLTTAVTWGSSAASVAAISNAAGSNGLATPVAVGSTTITATVGSISGSTMLSVTPATLVSLAVTPSSPSIALGTTQQFIATGTYSDGSTQNLTTAVTWGSSSASVAAISNAAGSNGLVTPVVVGSTTITATLGSKSGSTTLTVTPAILISIAVEPPVFSLTTGSTQQFTATGTFSDSTTQVLTSLATWSSSTAGVATVSNAAGSNGLATAVGVGSTVISSTWSGVSGTASLTVTAPPTVTLIWDAPTSYSDGTPLNPATDISTYHVYYGTASGVYTMVVSVPNPATSTITDTLTLPHGTYYFVVSDVDAAGEESSYSNEITATI